MINSTISTQHTLSFRVLRYDCNVLNYEYVQVFEQIELKNHVYDAQPSKGTQSNSLHQVGYKGWILRF